MNAKRTLVVVLSLIALAGCSQGASTSGPPESPTANSAGAGAALLADHNEADVNFLTGMIPHHMQALMMVDLAAGKPQSPEFAQLLADVQAAQAPEIDQMSGWLQEWGEPVPEMMMDHGQAGDMDAGDGMEGMLTGAEMTALAATEGDAFERAWLHAMVKHHRGAVKMAEAQLANGQHEGTLALAQAIVESQSAEIAYMRELLGS